MVMTEKSTEQLCALAEELPGSEIRYDLARSLGARCRALSAELESWKRMHDSSQKRWAEAHEGVREQREVRKGDRLLLTELAKMFQRPGEPDMIDGELLLERCQGLKYGAEGRRLNASRAVGRLREVFRLRTNCNMVEDAAEDACTQMVSVKTALGPILEMLANVIGFQAEGGLVTADPILRLYEMLPSDIKKWGEINYDEDDE